MIIKNTSENWTLSDMVLVLGNFDGVHLGHQLLIDKAKQIGREKGLKTGVLTLDPHPSKLFIGDKFQLIYTEAEKQELFTAQGLDYYILFPFDEESRNMIPQDFIQDILLDKIGVKAVVVGKDYRFGKKAAGGTDLLKDILAKKGVWVEVVDKLKMSDQDISSTYLRQAIKTGDLDRFTALTGRHFHISGRVENGQKLGRRISFPTTNLLPPKDKILPPNGVYLSEVIIHQKKYKGLSNVGISPSLDNKPYAVETYILDFDQEIYGLNILVSFVKFLRPEIKFSRLEDLKAQIERDVEDTRYFWQK